MISRITEGHMPRFKITLIVCAILLASASAYAQPASDATVCADAAAKPENRIKSCTTLIKAKAAAADTATLLTRRGVAYYENGDYKRAIADHSEVIRINPKDAAAYDNRGNAYRRNGEDDEAIVDYDKAIALDPKFVHAYVARGDSYNNKGDFDRAIAESNKAIAIDPKFPNSYAIRGAAQLDKKEYTRAIADFDEALKRKPDYAYALYQRGTAYERTDKPDRALADYNETIKVDPESLEGHQSRGILKLYGGSAAEAIADLKRASELSPKDSYSAIWYDLALRRNGQKGSLARARSKLDRVAWPAPLVRLMLNEIRPARALQLAKRGDANTAKDQTCETTYYIAETDWLKGQKDKARDGYRATRDLCRVSFFEHSAASAALRALGEK